jgi:hypothetical protein
LKLPTIVTSEYTQRNRGLGDNVREANECNGDISSAMRFEPSLQSLRHYRCVSDEVPFPEIERSCSTQNSRNVLTANVLAVKKYETESSALAGSERRIQQWPPIIENRIGGFRA